MLLLTFCQFNCQSVGLGFQLVIPCSRIPQGTGGEDVTTRKVSAQLAIGLFPATQGFSRRRQAGVEPESVKQPFIGKREQPLAVYLHGFLARAIQEPHLLQRKRPRRPTYPVLDLLRLGLRPACAVVLARGAEHVA